MKTNFRRSLLCLAAALPLAGCWTTPAYQAPKVVLLSASWCAPYKVLKEEMDRAKFSGDLQLTINSATCRLPISLLDLSKESDWNREEAEYGRFIGVPAIQIRGKKGRHGDHPL